MLNAGVSVPLRVMFVHTSFWQDKWSPNWSGKLTPSAEMLLSLFASQYSITQLEQSIV